jgi:hypothetical protein
LYAAVRDPPSKRNLTATPSADRHSTSCPQKNFPQTAAAGDKRHISGHRTAKSVRAMKETSDRLGALNPTFYSLAISFSGGPNHAIVNAGKVSRGKILGILSAKHMPFEGKRL